MNQTTQEINEAVAQKLGLKKRDMVTHTDWFDRAGNIVSPLLDYCHDIKAAWEIVDTIDGVRIDKNELGWNVIKYDSNQWPTVLAFHKSAPMAICLAFLKLNDTTL